MSTNLFSLEKKVAVVTGASRGIGRAIALGFATAGADVVVAARNRRDLDQVVIDISKMGGRALGIPTDVTRRNDVDRLLERTVSEFGRLDILVNNAGGTRFMAPMLELRVDGWNKLVDLNLTTVFTATQLAAQRMVKAGGGSIVQISSVAGIEGEEGLSAYSAAKGGVRLMTQAVAKELAASGVRLNCIAPGWIATELNAVLQDDETFSDSVISRIPMGRWGRVDDVVGAAIFLASDASSFVTGTTVVVDGGQTA